MGISEDTKTQKRILIVENEKTIGRLISEALSKQGYKVSWVEGGKQAFQSVKTFSPHLVIMSYEIPDITGLEFLRELRKQEIYINIIVMSARSDTSVMVGVFRSGADDFIQKPFRFQELFVRINSSLENNDLHRDLLKANEKLKKLVDLDYLTGLYNMRSMYDRIDMELRRIKRFQGAVACIMLDMDDFKSVNDQHDHLFGSFVIKEVGNIVSGIIGKFGMAARYGGDEFLVVLAEAQNDRASYFCERLRKIIEEYNFRDGENETQITVSLGYAVALVHEEGGELFPQRPLSLVEKRSNELNARELVRRADHALYQAKGRGKNRFVKFGFEEKP